MQNQKRNLIITTTLKREGRSSGIALLVGIGFELLVYLLGFILHPNLASLWVSVTGLPSSVTPLLTSILVFYFLITPYSDFKWAIQNGISRKTFWQGRIIAMGILVLGVWFIGQLIGLLDHPFYFGAARRSLLAYLAVVLTMMAIGNGFALLNRTWKWIVGIGGPVICFICLTYLGIAISNLGFISLSLMQKTFLVQLMSSTVTWWIILIIYLIIMLALTKVFSDRIQLRRD